MVAFAPTDRNNLHRHKGDHLQGKRARQTCVCESVLLWLTETRMHAHAHSRTHTHAHTLTQPHPRHYYSQWSATMHVQSIGTSNFGALPLPPDEAKVI